MGAGEREVEDGGQGGVEEKEVGRRSSLKSTGVGCTPPELGHAEELRSGQCGWGNRGVMLVDVVMKMCYRVRPTGGLKASTNGWVWIKAPGK